MRSSVFVSGLVPILVLCLFVGRNRIGLPDGLKGEVPVYPGAEIASTIKLSTPAGAHATLRTTATPANVLGFYKDALKNKGWSIKVERESFLALFRGNVGMMIDIEESAFSSSVVTIVAIGT